MVSKHFSPEWKADYLPHFVTTEIPLGEDPDGEGDICAYLTHYEGKIQGVTDLAQLPNQQYSIPTALTTIFSKPN